MGQLDWFQKSNEKQFDIMWIAMYNKRIIKFIWCVNLKKIIGKVMIINYTIAIHPWSLKDGYSGTWTNCVEVSISISEFRHPTVASCRFPFGSAWVQHDTN